MQGRPGLSGRALEHEGVAAVADDDVRDDLPPLFAHLGDGTVEEGVLPLDEVEDGLGVMTYQRRREEGAELAGGDDHDLLRHRIASNTASCTRPFVETALPPSARASPARLGKRPPASSTMTLMAARSHSATSGSTAISTAPSATSMCDQKSPKPRLRQQRRARARKRSPRP